MPCAEQVLVIEAALLGRTEAESKAIDERRRVEKFRKDEAFSEKRAKHWEESWEADGWRRRNTSQKALERARALFEAGMIIEDNGASADLVKALARCLDPEMADQSPFVELISELGSLGKKPAKPDLGSGVIVGPWAN